MGSEPESLILQLLRDMRGEMGDVRTDFKTEMQSLRTDVGSEMQSLRADVASDLLAAEARSSAEHKQTREQIVGLRRAVVEYHMTVIGHGILISD